MYPQFMFNMDFNAAQVDEDGLDKVHKIMQNDNNQILRIEVRSIFCLSVTFSEQHVVLWK